MKASEFRNKIAEVFKMINWNSGTQVSEFRKTMFELVKTKKLFRNTYFGVQVYEVMDHIFIRNQALQPQVKNYFSAGKWLIIFSNKEIIFFISDRRLHLVHLRRTPDQVSLAFLFFNLDDHVVQFAWVTLLPLIAITCTRTASIAAVHSDNALDGVHPVSLTIPHKKSEDRNWCDVPADIMSVNNAKAL